MGNSQKIQLGRKKEANVIQTLGQQNDHQKDRYLPHKKGLGEGERIHWGTNRGEEEKTETLEKDKRLLFPANERPL